MVKPKRLIITEVNIAKDVVVKMHQYRQTKARALEAGGVLLGRIIPGSGAGIIDAVTTPTREDHRKRDRFCRAEKGTQKLIKGAWKKSGGSSIYLGEWHTHPQASPIPSGLDLENWKRLVKKSTFEQSALIFVIVGTKTDCVWRYHRKENRLEMLIKVARKPKYVPFRDSTHTTRINYLV